MPYCNCPLKIAARENPKQLAIAPKLTYYDLDLLSDQFVKQLHYAKLGPHSLIAFQSTLSCESIALFFAALRMHANICPLSAKLPKKRLQDDLQKLQPHLWVHPFPLISHSLNAPPFPCSQSVLLYTSGSSAQPKIACLSLKSLLTNAQFSVPLTEEDRWLISLPLHHVAGIGIVLRCTLKQATMTFDPTDPQITHLSYVPTQLQRPMPSYNKLKCLLLGGAPLQNTPSHLPIYGTYGLTEMGSMVLTQKSPHSDKDKIYLGHPLPKREIKINEHNEILVRGETLFQGYLQTRTLILPVKDEWFATGDLATFDPKWGYAITGRKDWQFISGGENIQPEEIEFFLCKHPDVFAAVVLGKKNPEYGMRPIAFIEPATPYFSIEKVQEYLLQHLPKFKVPDEIRLIKKIPKKGQKIDRKKLYGHLCSKKFLCY